MISLARCRRILAASAEKHHISVDRLLTNTRTGRDIRARRAAIVAMHHLGASSTRIGEAVNRHHTTVLDNIKAAKSCGLSFTHAVNELGGVE